MKDLDKFKNEMNLSGQNVYVGHRYVPKIMGDWDNSQIYEPLSIVQYQGNSFTSRQYVPSGVELNNEEFWASTGNYNAQVEHYRQEVTNVNNEVVNARNGEANLKDRLDKEQQEVNTQLAQITVFPENFKETTDMDDTQSILRAINYCVDNGHGTVSITKTYNISDSILIPDYITLKGNGNAKLNYTLSDDKNIILLSTHSIFKDIDVVVPPMFKGVGILITSRNIDKRALHEFENIYLTKTGYDSNETNAIGIKYLGDGDDKHPTGWTGFWGGVGRNIQVNNFPIVFEMETKNKGWVNGVTLDHIIAQNFIHFMKTKDDGTGQGIDVNRFSNIYGQVNSITRDIFVDEVSTNYYEKFHFFDLRANPQAGLGFARNLNNPMTLRSSNYQLISPELNKDRGYTKIARFGKILNSSDYIILAIKGNRLQIDSEIMIHGISANRIQVSRRHYGSNKLTKDKLKFYLEPIGNGSFDLYYKVFDVKNDSNIHIISRSRDVVSSDLYEWYDNLSLEAFEAQSDIERSSISVPTSSYRISEIVSTSSESKKEMTFGERLTASDLITPNESHSQFTIDEGGVYLIMSEIHFEHNPNGTRSIYFNKNGEDFQASSRVPAEKVTNVETVLTAHKVMVIESGDSVGVNVLQNSDSTLSVRWESSLTIIKIGDM